MSVVIVGAGHGGVQVAATLREVGYAEQIILLDAQNDWPYQRPPLSKEYLKEGEDGPQPLRGEGYFETHDIDLRLGTEVAAIAPEAKEVHLADGERLDYQHLVLATGSVPRTLTFAGSDLDGVLMLGNRSDADRLREELSGSRNVLVVGGGFIGLEIAAAAAAAGSIGVVVVEPQDRVLARAVVPLVSQTVQRAHERLGTTIRLGTGLEGLVGGDDGRVCEALLSDGTSVKADLVLVAVGVGANCDLAAAAGLDVDNGIVVDARQRTSAPGVFAIGDCASKREPGLDRPRRLECVQSAVEQARHVASVIVHDDQSPFAKVPWFWTFQPDLRIQTVGVGGEDDECVVLGDAAVDAFSVCRFQEGRLVAVESVNRPADHMAARRILDSGDLPSAVTVREPGFELKAYARRTSPA